MILRQRKKRGQSLIEFIALMLFILAALMVFQKYLVRGFSGRWKGVGDALGQERIYDPNKTIECAASAFFPGPTETVQWYDRRCFDRSCIGACLQAGRSAGACSSCISSCQTPYCS